MENCVLIDAEFIEQHTNYNELVAALKAGFSKREIIVPQRHHHNFPNPIASTDTTLLLMPAWDPKDAAGVKMVTVNPENGKYNLPAIQGTYVYWDANQGTLRAILEAKSLTAKRTAATSALASSLLSRKGSSSLLMIGTGALSINLIRAHASVRPIEKVHVWGRNPEKAKEICEQLKEDTFKSAPVREITDVIRKVDIISVATLSKDPLILGEWLKSGQHIDLVGSYDKDRREADDEAILKSTVFVDDHNSAPNESGDLYIPIQKGIFAKENIKADLFELCAETKSGRSSKGEITLFKSVGHALEDLVAASYYYNKYQHV